MSESKEEEQEEVIPIVDTHIHLWNVKTAKRDWLSSPGMEDINRTFDINAYYTMYNNQSAPCVYLKYGLFMETHVDDADIDTEINEISALCKNPNNNLRGIVAKLDPSISQQAFLERLSALKQNPFIVGIRKVLFNHGFKDNEIPPSFIPNLKVMQDDKDITWPFDIATNIELLDGMETMIKALPNQMFVLDHMGNHHQICGDDKLCEKWKQSVRRLSKYENVCIKLSALTGGQPGLTVTKKWSFEAEREHVDVVIDAFSEDRIVYGCDWPVSLVALDKDQRDDFLRLWTVNLYKYLKSKKGKQFCDKVFVQNAVRIYNLQL